MRRYSLLLLLLGNAVMIYVMIVTGAPLKIPTDTPKGILDLEFAYNTSKTAIVTTAWAPHDAVDNISAAKINTYFDFLFIFFYTSFLFFTCEKIARISSGKFRKAGVLIASGVIYAGLLDIVENSGMLMTLSGHSSPIIALVTAVCSVIKWLLALSAVLYCLAGLIYSITTKKTKSLLA